MFHALALPSDFGNSEIVSLCFSQEKTELRYWFMDWTPEYKKNVSTFSLNLNSKIMATGAWGASEISLNKENLSLEKHYIRLQLTNLSQNQQIIEILSAIFLFSLEQKNVLSQLFLKNNFPLKRGTHPCYFIGTVREGEKIKEVRFFFQAYDDRVPTKKQSLEVLDYLKTIPGLEKNSPIRMLIESDLILLDGFALDFFEDGTFSPKFLFVPTTNLSNLLDVLKTRGYEIPVDFQDIQSKDLNLFCFQTAWDRNKCVRFNVYFRPYRYQNPIFYSIPEHIILRNICGIYFLINIKRKDYYDQKKLNQINFVGAKIVEIIQENQIISSEGIIKRLFEVFDASKDELFQKQIRNDTLEFINYLVQEGLVKKHEG